MINFDLSLTCKQLTPTYPTADICHLSIRRFIDLHIDIYFFVVQTHIPKVP